MSSPTWDGSRLVGDDQEGSESVWDRSRCIEVVLDPSGYGCGL